MSTAALFTSFGSRALALRDQTPSTVYQVPASAAAVMAFNILSAAGFLMCLALLLTAWLSPNVHRVSTWYMYIVAWIMFCNTPFPILGHQGVDGTEPPTYTACLVDEALMYASRPFAGFATLSLTLHLYLNISTRLNRSELHPHVISVLLAIPPISYLIMLLWTLVLGITDPTQVVLEPGGFYCHLQSYIPAIVGGVLVSLATSISLLIQALTVVVLYRNWSAFRALQRRNEDGISLSIIVRVSVFGFFPLVGLILSFTAYMPDLLIEIWPVYNILLASLPPMAALVFGSQSDILSVWNFWSWRRETLKSNNTKLMTSVGTFSTVGPYSP